MISTWNFRGINKEVRHREVSSYFSTFKVPIIALLETRVKKDNVSTIRRKFGNYWSYLDNYSHHHNGRIWLMWKDQEIRVNLLQCEEQYLHVEVKNLDNKVPYLATIMYALSQPDRRKLLWSQIDHLGSNITLPWIVIGDFNNVLTSQDMIGGNRVHTTEYTDLAEMMHKQGLFEAPTRGCYYTWSNKHTADPIYSRIDRLLGNSQWFQDYSDVIVEVLPPSISDHSPIRVSYLVTPRRRKSMFKFLNCVTKKDGYLDIVKDSWNQRTHGYAMQRLWYKMKRLQQPLKTLQKSFNHIQIQILKARTDLIDAQHKFGINLFDEDAVVQVKNLTATVLELSQLEEHILMQRSKVEWLRQGDGNNKFFYSTIKEKNKQKAMHTLTSSTGEILSSKEDITNEVLEFYTSLVGTASETLAGINLPCILKGPVPWFRWIQFLLLQELLAYCEA
ncbi:uncharacterized protein LOC131633337 [Vicia villosa]|uniref:uncharacterized protein LOC131633337 n=1 Tax=Vicia villosa TaxID=3911 RepID=UPI00273C3237|nr:uncharacterized protein LOC131633337 [Vicia villosa]